MSTASFIGHDLITSGAWLSGPGLRGTAGYWFADPDTANGTIESYPAYISGVTVGSFTYAGGGNAGTAPARPGGGTPLTARFYTASPGYFPVSASDTAPHYLSIYCCDDPGGTIRQTITIQDNFGAPLASHALAYDFTGGVWVCFLVSGPVRVQISIDHGGNTVVSGIVWDETEPARAAASDSTAYTFAPSGGVQLGGSSGSIVAFAAVSSGGLTLGGEAGIGASHSHTVSPSGGLALGAAAGSTLAAAVAPSGGVSLGGAADVVGSTAYVFTPSGGAAFGGSSSAFTAWIVHPAGGLAVGGEAGIGASHSYTVSPSGGLALGAATGSTLAAVVAPSGGVSLGGAADVVGSTAYVFTPSGGAAFGGSSSAFTAWIVHPAGGSTLGGAAVVAGAPQHFVFVPAGGVAFGGAIYDASAAGTIREAVVARLRSTDGVSSVVGSRIYFRSLPQTQAFPAVTYFVPVRTYGHNLLGADGLSTARVQISAWSNSVAEADAVARAIRDRFDGFQGYIGRVEVTSCLAQADVDLAEPPRDGSDAWTYQIACDYLISHRVPRPALLIS